MAGPLKSIPPQDTAAVVKLFAVLETLGTFGEMPLSELSIRVAMPKPTLHRFVQTLLRLGYLRQADASERYGLALKLFELGSQALRQPDWLPLAQPQMQALSADSGEAVQLGLRNGGQVLCVHGIASRHTLAPAPCTGRGLPLHATALGKALLAFDDDARALPPLQRHRPATLATPEALDAELRRTRARGHAFEDEEFEAFVCAVAVPLFDARGRAAAALAIVMPTVRATDTLREHHAQLLRQASRALSHAQGARWPLDDAR